jgi:hypothetical protein
MSELTNEQRSAAEVAAFIADKPDRYFLYVAADGLTVTTWMGDKLGDVIHRGNIVRDNFGGRRRAIRVRAINGCNYHGWANESSGTYARLRKTKA